MPGVRQLMNDVVAKDRWVLGWEGTVEFFEQNRNGSLRWARAWAFRLSSN